VYHP
jgi:hypothetical protein